MTKVVIHNNWGGFNLSDEAMETLKALKGEVELYTWSLERDDPDLITIVERFGEDAGSDLKIIDLPDDVISWYIHDYDGMETIHESHRSW
tara:strand:+ start:220 stop:489 length:270 start_codon:yes stop_codon:yes gene_type:complete